MSGIVHCLGCRQDIAVADGVRAVHECPVLTAERANHQDHHRGETQHMMVGKWPKQAGEDTVSLHQR